MKRFERIQHNVATCARIKRHTGDIITTEESDERALIEVADAGCAVEDILEVPALLGDSAKATVQRAIDRFRAGLAKLREDV